MITPFHIDDWKNLSGDTTERVRRLTSLVDVSVVLSGLAREDLCCTVLTPNGQHILGIVGAAPVAKGVCEIFILSSSHQRSYPVTFARALVKKLKWLRTQFPTIRATTEGRPEEVRLLEWAGFTKMGMVDRPEFEKPQQMWGLT